jgi:hypothetical protein
MISREKLRIPSRKTTAIKWTRRSIKLALLLLPIIALQFVIGSVLNYMNTFSTIFTDDVYVSPDLLMDSDPALLADYADRYQQIMELYHVPKNLTGDGWDYYVFTDATFGFNPAEYPTVVNESTFLEVADPLDPNHPLNQVTGYGNTGHGAVYAGLSAIGQGMRYAVAVRENRTEDLPRIRNHILEVVKGFSLLSEVTGTGMPVRAALPDTPKARALYGDGFFHIERWGSHLYLPLSYTGPNNKSYTFYVETGTSMDCVMPIFCAFGIIYQLVDDVEIRAVIRAATDRMLTYFANVGWRLVDLDGKTHNMGAEAITGAPLSDPGYAMLYLRVGKTVYPEKWGKVYDKYAYDRMMASRIGRQASVEFTKMFAWAGGYFNLNLQISMAGCLSFLEDDPQLKAYYVRQFLTPLHSFVRYHRNAWFSLMYYLGCSVPNFMNYNTTIQIPDNSRVNPFWQEYISRSAADSLMRFCLRHYPYRQFPHANGLDSYSNPLFSRIPGAPYPDSKPFEWQQYVNMNNPIVAFFSQFYYPDNMWDQPRPTDWAETTSWIWECNAFSRVQFHWGGVGQGGNQPGAYISVYWIARYLNLPDFAI